MTELQPVLLSGGSGTRLWPLSREAFPKQFLAMAGQETMLQATWRRVAPLASAPPIVVANEEHRFLVAEQLRQVGAPRAAIVLEPVGRNTAPAIAAAALQATVDGGDPLLLVLPSDHVVTDEGAFHAAVRVPCPPRSRARWSRSASSPTRPRPASATSRPRRATACAPCAVSSRSPMRPPLPSTSPMAAITGTAACSCSVPLATWPSWNATPRRSWPRRAASDGATRDGDFIRLDRAAFEACPSDSIDYAVMEKTDRAMVLPVDIGWNDVGSWSALWQVSEQDADGNAYRGDVIAVDSRNTFAYARRLVALVGVDDLVVVETDDAVLVARKDRVQQVKDVVARLKAEQRSHAVLHREVHRPWGSYDSIDQADGFQVKRIKVKPGGRLSLQSHARRAEHWIVVRGTARVTRDNDVFDLHANQSTFIPLGAKHRLENPGAEVLELIEVQSGDYLGEDDIVRYEDVYGRS